MKVTTSKDLGSLVRDQRTRLGWTQEALAAQVGVSRLWIVQLEKGKPTAQISLVLRTLKELGVALDASVPASGGLPRKEGTVVDLGQIINRTLPGKP